MHKLMCTFMTPMKKKIPDRNLDTSCPAGIPCNKIFLMGIRNRLPYVINNSNDMIYQCVMGMLT